MVDVTQLDTALSYVYLEGILRSCLNNDDLTIVGTETVSGGFLSMVLRVLLSSTNETVPSSIIIKIINMEAAENQLKRWTGGETYLAGPLARMQFLQESHANECASYDILAGTKLPLAKCFHHIPHHSPTNAGLLILEDLGRLGACANFFDGLNYAQLDSVIDGVVQLHAHSLSNNGWRDCVRPMCREEDLMRFLPFVSESASTLRTQYPDSFTVSNAEIEQLVQASSEIVRHLALFFSEHGQCAVLTHGDLKPQNLLYRYNDDGTFADDLLAILDWQAAHVCWPAEDLCRLVLFNLTGEKRRKQQRDVLITYYDKLRGLLGHTPPFTLELLESWFAKAFPIQAAMHVFMTDVYLSKSAGDMQQDVMALYAKSACEAVVDALTFVALAA